jgi:hypothetical protein
MKKLLISFAALSLLLFGPVRQAGALTSIQPGDSISTTVGGCTLGFGATSGGETYYMTAAHCVEHVGDSVELDDGTVLGQVAAIGNANNTGTDWSLIRVAPGLSGLASGVLRGHAAPTGVAKASQTATGDLIDHSGYGIPWFISPTLREQRFGVLIDQDATTWVSIGPDTQGDSGGPVLHRNTGGALGLVSRLCIGLCTSEGPTVEGILPQAAAKGFPLTLKTG